jgi:glycosyltransferase involved in cell wall biosynthesis
MNILFITPQLPFPPHQGAAIRNYSLIASLSQRHTIDLLTFTQTGSPLPADHLLYRYCRRIGVAALPHRSTRLRALDAICSPLPDMALRLESSDMRTLIQAWIQAVTDPQSQTVSNEPAGYDIVQIEGIEVAQYGLHVVNHPAWGKHKPALVFDNHNCEYLLQKRNALTDLRILSRWPAALYSLVQWRKLVRYERVICQAANAVSAVSEADRQALLQLDAASDIAVISNGLNMAEYPVALPSEQRQEQTLLFTGKMDYRPNIDAVLWFCRHVLPLIQQEAPKVKFQIVGMNPHSRLDEVRHMKGVEITGAVDMIQPYMNAAAVYVIPLRVGGGTRFKALEAMASAKAIVSTRLGMEGIQVQHEKELLLADAPAEFAEAALRLLRQDAESNALAARLGHDARTFVAAHYDWRQIIPLFEQIYDRLT